MDRLHPEGDPSPSRSLTGTLENGTKETEDPRLQEKRLCLQSDLGSPSYGRGFYGKNCGSRPKSTWMSFPFLLVYFVLKVIDSRFSTDTE